MKTSGSFGSFIKSKFVRIMVPYFIWAFLFLIPFALFGGTVADSFNLSTRSNYFEIVGNVLYGIGKDHRLQQNSALWFLPALFVMYAFYFGLIRFVEKANSNKARIGLLVVLALIGNLSNTYLITDLPWGINTVLVAGVYFYVGYLLREHDLIQKIVKFRLRRLLYCVLLALGLLAGSYNKALGFMDYTIGNVWLAYTSGICFSVLILCAVYSIGKCDGLEYIGRNTLPIMIFHKLPILVIQTKLGVVSSLLINSNVLVEVMLGLIATAVATLFSVAVAEILRIVAPYSIGEKRKSLRLKTNSPQ